MRAKADSKRKRRAAFAAVVGFMLLASVRAACAQGMDASDRQDKMDINREGAETRIERLHEDRARSRAQEKMDHKKSGRTPKRRQQRLQY